MDAAGSVLGTHSLRCKALHMANARSQKRSSSQQLQDANAKAGSAAALPNMCMQ